MNTSAIVMMVISMVFLWGGLTLSIIHLSKHPEELDDVLEEVKDQHTL
ncbi:methionine/alanine import family NSS transporter small subunit [Acinetobacter pittii]|nr:methionine/alanine import family NSS transporter small subunit [Acinetobacter pittii]QRQ13949.1 methionine/alanine import family NSS transporter small subunit [Acinetobacter pittii]